MEFRGLVFLSLNGSLSQDLPRARTVFCHSVALDPDLDLPGSPAPRYLCGPDELADFAWYLCLRLAPGPSGSTPASPVAEPAPVPLTKERREPEGPFSSPGWQVPPEVPARPAPDRLADLRAIGRPGAERAREIPGRVVRSPAGHPLPEAVEMARALRPLRRWVPRYTEESIDEEATADRIAEFPLAPVVVPQCRADRTLETVVVAEFTSTMRFWESVFGEFQRLLLRAGVVRRVHRFDLLAADDSERPLALRRGSDGREFETEALLRHAGRRLILFFSDALSPAWEDGRIPRLLHRWGRHGGRTTFFHVLPPRLWAATELAAQTVERVHGPRPGELRWLDPVGSARLVRQAPMVLLAAFSPEYVRAWASTLGAHGINRLTAFTPVWAADPPARLPPPVRRPPPSPARALETFRAAASPMALELAGYLAAAPLYPPVMRLVQQALLPRSTREHLAEVLLGGLLYRPSEENEGDPPAEETLYEFLPGGSKAERGVRDLLLEEQWASHLVKVLRTVSEHVENRFGREVLNFRAILEDPRSLGSYRVSKHLVPFARVGAKVLLRLGGEHAEAGRRLAAFDPESSSLPPPRPARYALLLGRKGDPSTGLDALEHALSHHAVGNFLSVQRVWLDDREDTEKRLAAFYRHRVTDDLLVVALAGPFEAWPMRRITEEWPPSSGARLAILAEHFGHSLESRLTSPSIAAARYDFIGLGQSRATAPGAFLAAVAHLLEEGWADRSGSGVVRLEDLQAEMRRGTFLNQGSSSAGDASLVQCEVKDSARQAIVSRNPRHRPIPDLGLEFLRLPAGHFVMGSPEGEAERGADETQHSVVLTHDIWMGTTPVTQQAWTLLMDQNPSSFQGDPRLPVDSVTWDEAKEFCRRLTEREHKTGRLPGSMIYTLPTEAEWEHACRAGITTPFAIGDGYNLTPDLANFDGNHPYGPQGKKGEYRQKTTPVKLFSPNPWGLSDMHGNVHEWCEDWYAPYPSGEATNPLGPETGSYRVLRGGSWFSDAGWCRSAYRIRWSPDFRNGDAGFRVAAVQAGTRDRSKPEARSGGGGAEAGDAPRAVELVELVEINPGTFWMGSPTDEQGRFDDEVRHRVTLTQPFRLGRYPVTQRQFEQVMGTNPSRFKTAGARAPVENVSWEDALEFCRRLTELDHQNGELPTGWIYTLPTEAQWEYACRAGAEGAIYTNAPWEILGQNNAPALDPIAWYGGNSGVEYEGGADSSGWPEKQYEHKQAGTHVVGVKEPNAWGLYDMLGNVYEWCWDWFGEYPKAYVSDPMGPETGSVRVLRGGSWISVARRCRSADRDWWPPDNRIRYAGFRVAAVQAGSGQARLQPEARSGGGGAEAGDAPRAAGRQGKGIMGKLKTMLSTRTPK